MNFSLLSVLILWLIPLVSSQRTNALVSAFKCSVFTTNRCCRALMVVECYEYCYLHLKDNCPQFIFEVPNAYKTTTTTTPVTLVVNQKGIKPIEQAEQFVLKEASSAQFSPPNFVQRQQVQPNIPQTGLSGQILNQLSSQLLGRPANAISNQASTLGNQANNLFSQLGKMFEPQSPLAKQQPALPTRQFNQLQQPNTFFGTPVGNPQFQNPKKFLGTPVGNPQFVAKPQALVTAPVVETTTKQTVPQTITYNTLQRREVVRQANSTIQTVSSQCNSSSLRERPTNELCVTKDTANTMFQQCCRQHVPRQCWGLCHYETDDKVARQRLYVTTLYDGCAWEHLGSVLHCAAQNRDNRRCCRELGLADNKLGAGERCLRMCDVKGSAGLGSITRQDRACLVNWNVLMFCHWHGIDY